MNQRHFFTFTALHRQTFGLFTGPTSKSLAKEKPMDPVDSGLILILLTKRQNAPRPVQVTDISIHNIAT